MKLHFVFTSLCLTFCIVALAGCGRDSVDAVPRKSPFKPIVGMEKARAATPSVNGLDLSFLNRDHFACFCINLSKVISNPDLADVPWDLLEQQFEDLVGQDNSRLAGIERVWILLDRERFSLLPIGNGQPSSPVVVVMDYKAPLNQQQLAEAEQLRLEQEKLTADDSDPETSSFAVKKIDDRRIAFGGRQLLAKLDNQDSSSGLANELKQMKLDSDIEGLVSLAPIRSALQGVFDMVAQFGGESVAKFSQLPEVTQRIEFKLSLVAKDTLVATVFIDDDKLTKEIARLANDTSSPSNPAFGGGLPFGPAMGGQPPESMVPVTSTEVFQEIGKQIAEDKLFTVTGADQKVTFKLQRPSKLKALITATIEDAKRQYELGQRVRKLRAVTAAIQKYQDKFGSFPPAGIQIDNADGLPDQFSWRVGLLPFLGEQELYDQFDFKQPWDSETNQQVANQIPDVFAASGASDSNSNLTRLHVVGGKLGLYKTDRIPKLSDVSDKKIWTAVVVEGALDSAVNWTQPGSLPISQADVNQFGNEDEKGILFSNVAFDTRIIRKNGAKLRAILTPDGDEGLTKRDFLSVTVGQ